MAYLARFLCVGFAVVLMATGCAGPRPLKGGRAITTRKPAGIVEQTLVQGENPLQASKQTQETVKVRSYTVPQAHASKNCRHPVPPQSNYQPSTLNLSTCTPQRSTRNPQPLSPSAPQCP